MNDVLALDIGGAHLKLARLHREKLIEVRQIPCPLWQGLEQLGLALGRAVAAPPAGRRVAVTMTGEMADLFPDRASGVRAILKELGTVWDGARISVYGLDGFLSTEAAIEKPAQVASANWHATGRFVAALRQDALLVDIGSTTTDLLPVRGGAIAARGFDDAARLTQDELVYTGIVRTPVMAIASHVEFAGARQGVAAEYFAAMADVYRLTGQLPPDADQQPSADGRGKSLAESRARLARMVGRDASSAGDAAWAELARQFAARQIAAIETAARRVLADAALAADAPLIGAGIGRFLVEALARRLGRAYLSFAALVPADAAIAERAADCAPAASLALLLGAG